MAKQLLFVTYHDENMLEGLAYATDLAKTMHSGIGVLIIYKRKLFDKVDDMMTAVVFAEQNEFRTAREVISEDFARSNGDFEKTVAMLTEQCKSAKVPLEVSVSDADAISAVKNMLRQNTNVEMILLSPSITVDGAITTKALNKLVKSASRPVVTMSKQASVA